MLVKLTKQHLEDDSLTLKRTVEPDGRAIIYCDQAAGSEATGQPAGNLPAGSDCKGSARAGNGQALNRSTLWRWLSWLGCLTVSLELGVELYLQRFPDSTVHRFTGAVSPRKSRSPLRDQTLRNARRLLDLIRRWDEAFPKERFFPRFATRARPP